MAQSEDYLTERRPGASSTQIRNEIERTRADMDETFAALDAKLTPSQLALEVWNLAKGGGTAGAGKLFRIARQHPMPAAVIGLGLGWLLVERSRSSERPRYDGRASFRQGYSASGSDDMGAASSAKEALSGAREKMEDAAGWTKEHASDLSHKARETASDLRDRAKSQAVRARAGFWETLEENPLMVGAATLALGVIAGLAIPSTRKEDELMGKTRDHLFEEVKEMGHEALDKTKQAAGTVVERVKEEAGKQGLTPGGLAEKAKTVAAEAKNVVKEEAKGLKPEALRQEESEPELVRR